MRSPSERREAPKRRVARQLVEALLFERIVAASATPEGDATRFSWTAGGRTFRCLGAVRGFGRVSVQAGSIEIASADGGWRGAALKEIVDAASETEERAAGLLDQLERTIKFCQWNEAHLPRRDRRAMAFSALDCALDEGHPYHPCHKARVGFDERDHAEFGPETGAPFRLEWLLVRRALVARSLPCSEEDFFRTEIGERGFADLSARREALGLSSGDFALAPLHPWQMRRLEDGPLAGLIADGDVHALGAAGDRYVASQSVRTLHNLDDPAKSSVKLAMDITNSSSLRTIEPHSVCVAPALSRWLRTIVEGDPDLAGRLAILDEHSGLVVDRAGPLAGRFAAIWRRGVASMLASGESAVPFNALMAVEGDGRLFAAPWLDRHGAAAWLDRLIEVAVIPVWRLLVRHGVATEAHGQNMILVHRDGWPERVILRDFHDSLEYAPDFLRDPSRLPDLAAVDPVYRDAPANRFHRMDGVEELRALVVDCLFVFNLSDLALAFGASGILPEDAFWARVERALSAHAARSGDADRLARLGWRAPRIAVERLLAPRLGSAAARSVTVPNMFSAPPSRAGETMIQIEDESLSRAEFDTRSGRWAERVALGTDRAGARYAVCLPDAADWLALFLALKASRSSVLPIHPATPYPAARRLAEKAGCDRLVFGDRGVETLHPGQSAMPGELIQMSSGTTGAPKCVSRGWDEIGAELASYVGAFHEPDDMTPVVACPTTHSYGLICGVLAAMERGRAPVVVAPSNPKHLLKLMRETERPLLYSSPAVLHTLARLSPADAKMHAVMTSGTLLPSPWFSQIRARSGRMFQQYGCSEAGCVAVNREVAAADEMGEPLPHLKVRAEGERAAPGEIVVEGPSGKIRTGDLGYLKGDGSLVFVARLDDTINVSGLNVYPGEVEDVAMANPAVADAVAFRVADAFAGERVGLMVAGAKSIETGALRDWCRANLATHQLPVDIVQVDAIPRQANGKISRREAAAMHAGLRSGAMEAAQ